MFVDLVELEVQAGRGGDGLVSFRREKFVDKGGPNGGDGGSGGSIIFRADAQESSLAKFRQQRLIRADDGQPGGPSNRRGKTAADVIISVPVGTCVFETGTGELLADLQKDKARFVVASGGQGGFGNAHFKTSRRQTPLLAEKGLPGHKKQLKCELKLVADVGIIGLPNAGKSTFLSVVSKARPTIAAYPFTTLTPNLGVADIDGQSLLLADIPGLIEGASTGKGLGHQFLRHAERSRALLHLIDAYSQDVVKDYQIIRAELAGYSQLLEQLPEVVAITKIESMTAGQVRKLLAQLRSSVPAETKLLSLSSQAHLNLPATLRALTKAVEAYSPTDEQSDQSSDMPVFGLSEAQKADHWRVELVGDYYLITGGKIDKFAQKTHFDSHHSLNRLKDIMRKLGISHELVRRGYDGQQVLVFGQPEIGRLSPEI